MAKGVNRVTLLGHVGKDPEVNYTPGGLCIAKFSLATTEGRKNADGEFEDKTEWHRLVFFGKIAENVVANYVHKGSLIYVEGKISYGSYETDGVKKYTTDIIGNNIQLLDSKNESQEPQAPKRAPASPDVDDSDSSLPF